MLVGGNLILAIGGQDSCGANSGLIEAYDLQNRQLGWQHATSFGVPDLLASYRPVFLSAIGVELVGNDGGPAFGVVVMGGNVDGGFTGTTLGFSPNEPESWLTDPALPSPLTLATAVVDGNGCIELIGGGTAAGPTASIETYCNFFSASGDVGGGGSWTTSSIALPSADKAGSAAQDAAGNIYFAGGLPPGNFYMIDAQFSSLTSLWETPSDHYGGGASVSNGQFFVIGGSIDIENPARTIVDVYNLSSQTWSPGPALNLPRQFFATVTDGAGNIYAIGGQGGQGQVQVYGSMEVLAPDAGSWKLVP